MLDTQTNLAALLKDPDLLATQGYLGGDWTDGAGGATFPVTNPARGDVIAEVADLSREQAAAAIDAAYTAQKEWAAWTGKERAAVLRKWFDLMVEHADDLGTILTASRASRTPRPRARSSMVPASSSGSPRKPSAPMAKRSPATSATSGSP